MHQRNKGKKFLKNSAVCLPVCLVSFFSVLWIQWSLFTTAKLLHVQKITLTENLIMAVLPSWWFQTTFIIRRQPFLTRFLPANSQDVWEIYSCEKMRISQAQHEDFTNCQTSTQNGDRCWSIIEPFLPWIFAILKNVQKSNVRKNVSFPKPFLCGFL